VIPLRRNRDFLLLQTGQLLSTLGSNSSSIAYPLLVLGLTHSPVKAGIVTFARTIPYPLFSLLAGVAADRWNRKWLMIVADVIGVAAIGTLAALILTGAIAFWQIPIVSFVDGIGSVLFLAAQSGALRAVVERRQLPAATATEVGRLSVVRLAGPPLGGALFGIARALPFVVDAASYVFSTVSLLVMRTPFQEERVVDRTSVRAQMAEGVRYLWSQPFLRTCALLFGIGNFIFPGVLLAIVVAGKRQGLSGGEIGALTAAFGAVLLVGSLVSPLFRRVFSVRQILLLELWTWTGGVFFLIWPNVYVLTAAILPQALTIPSTDSVVHGYRIAMTPDRLLGRVEGAARNISLIVTPLGPLLAGVLISAVSLRAAVGVFAAAGLALAVWGTLSPAIRQAPSLDELDHQPPAPDADASVAITA
jgi:MFS family permease